MIESGSNKKKVENQGLLNSTKNRQTYKMNNQRKIFFFHNYDSYKSSKIKWNLYYFQILIQLKINIQFNYGWIFYCSGHCLFIGFLFTYLKRWRFVCLVITMENSIIVDFLRSLRHHQYYIWILPLERNLILSWHHIFHHYDQFHHWCMYLLCPRISISYIK